MITLKNSDGPISFETWKFPGGEVGVKITGDIKSQPIVHLTLNGVPTSDDVFVVLNLLNAIRNIAHSFVILETTYLPYARQDRVCNPGESLALEVFIRVIWSHQHLFHYWKMSDVHNEKAFFDILGKIDYIESTGGAIIIVPQDMYSREAIKLVKPDIVIAPDAGASNKIKNVEAFVLTLTKTRVGSKVVYDDLPYDSIEGTALVVDDIIDGGATFLALGEMLKRTQPRITSLSLFATHGLFSKGLDSLGAMYDNIYCANDMRNPSLSLKVRSVK